MKINLSLITALMLVSATSLFAQHSLQFDDGNGHYAILSASGLTAPMTIFTFPPGGGMLGGGGSGSSWDLTGNALAGAGNAPIQWFGTSTNDDVIMKANNIEILRLISGGGIQFAGFTGGLVQSNGSGVLSNGDLSGDITTTGSLVTTLATVNGNVGGFGDATHVSTFTVNAKGLITAASNTLITGTTPGGAAGGDLTGTYPNPTLANTAGARTDIGLGAASSPTFTGLTLSGVNTGGLVQTDGSGVLSNGDLSGDITTTGSLVTTLATVNGNVGGFGDATHVSTFTVNAKGLITAASNTLITGTTPGGAAGGDLTGTYPNPTLANTAGARTDIGLGAASSPTFTGLTLSGVNTGGLVQTDGSGVLSNGDLSGDITTTGSLITTLATVNGNVGGFGDATHVSTFTVNAKGLITAASNTLITGTTPGGAAGGDLTGTYPNPTVSNINGNTIPADAAGFLSNNGSGVLSWNTGGSIALTGDVNGTTGANTIDPTNSGIGDRLISGINNGTTTIDAARIAAGLTDAQVNDNLTINGGTVDNSPIGATTESTGRFTTSEVTTVLGAASTPAAGTTYRDNGIVAWGDIAAAGVVNDQFGNVVVAHTPGTGVYTVTLPNAPTAAATNVTLQSLGLSTVTRAGAVLTVTTYDTTGTPTDLDFYFITVARP